MPAFIKGKGRWHRHNDTMIAALPTSTTTTCHTYHRTLLSRVTDQVPHDKHHSQEWPYTRMHPSCSGLLTSSRALRLWAAARTNTHTHTRQTHKRRERESTWWRKDNSQGTRGVPFYGKWSPPGFLSGPAGPPGFMSIPAGPQGKLKSPAGFWQVTRLPVTCICVNMWSC